MSTPRLFFRKDHRRLIDALRAEYPGRWTYRADRIPQWQHESGWGVTAYAQLAPKYEGDDESFVTVYYRSDTNERLHLP